MKRADRGGEARYRGGGEHSRVLALVQRYYAIRLRSDPIHQDPSQ
jgi:hypothetical protein